MNYEIKRGMSLIDVEITEVRCLVEFSLTDLTKLRDVLDMVTIDYDGKCDKDRELAEFLTGEFYPQLDKIIKQIQGTE